MNKVAHIAVVPLLALAASYALAQEPYPSRPVTLIDPFPPSGPIDILVRALAKPLQRILKQPVAVSYQAGAGGTFGSALVANAAPDGYTLLVAPSSVATMPEVDKLSNRVPAYTPDQLIGVALLSAQPPILVVHPSLPAKTAHEFIELAKSHPGELVVFRGSAPYGGLHMPLAMLEVATGTRFRYLVTTGGGPAMSAVLSGHAVAYAAGLSTVTPHIRTGRVRPLAHWGSKRLPELPEVPSFKELGVDVEFYDWFAIFAPAKTPSGILRALQDALRQAVQDPDFKAEMQTGNQRIDYKDGDDFRAWYQHEQQRLTDTVRSLGRLDERR